MNIRLSLLAATAVASLFLAQSMAARAEHHEGPHGAGHGMMKAKMEQKFKEIDADKDGKISKAEHSSESEKMFTEKDTNKDGFITKDEIDAHFAAKRARWQEHKGSALPPVDAPAAPAVSAPAVSAPVAPESPAKAQ